RLLRSCQRIGILLVIQAPKFSFVESGDACPSASPPPWLLPLLVPKPTFPPASAGVLLPSLSAHPPPGGPNFFSPAPLPVAGAAPARAADYGRTLALTHRLRP